MNMDPGNTLREEDEEDAAMMSASDNTPLHSPPTRPTTIRTDGSGRIPTISGGSGSIPGVNEPLSPESEALTPNPCSADPETESKKKGCLKRCVNISLLPLKLLVFIFYGGIGVLSTWLNHNVLSKRFTERESALIFGLSALLSIPIPLIFGLISDRSAQPKKVLAICLFLASLLSPLVMIVPATEPYHYKERLDWCRRQLGRNQSTCLPNYIKCTDTFSELISHSGKCGEACSGKLVLTSCTYNCEDPSVARRWKGAISTDSSIPTGNDITYDYDDEGNRVVLEPEPQIYDRHRPPSGSRARAAPRRNVNYTVEPHVCFLQNKQTSPRYKSPLCHFFDSDMHDVVLDVSEISGTIDDEDGKCHYPLLGYSETKRDFEQLMSCSPLSAPNCHVSCSLHWNFDGTDQWVCGDTYRQWLISFFVFLAAHTAGTMLIVTAAGLVHSAILCSVHEHEHGEFLGCQYVYAALGYAILTPATAYLFQEFEWQANQWNVAYIVAFSSWLFVSGILSLCLPYNAEWVPKTKEIRPMLSRWIRRSSTILFFHLIVTLGCLQGIIDVLGYYQIRSIVGSQVLELGALATIGLTATAAVIPGFVFIFRVERVIEFCGYQNLLAISLVVFSLQFAGYAYLKDVVVEWGFLIKALDIFSIIMVLITSSLTIHASAPRRLVATCQTVLVILYCCIGRGFGGLLTNLGLLVLEREYLFKIASLCCAAICLLFIIFHYTCLKPVPYTKKYNLDKLPESQGPGGKYIPLKLVSHKDKPDDQERNTEEM